MKHLHNIGYAVLLISLSLTLPSCSIFHKHKSVTKNSTDSTAYNKIESSLQQHQSEAWNNYLKFQDNNSLGITFYNDSNNYVKVNPDGSFEASGSIKDVWHKSKKQTIKKESWTRYIITETRYINTTYTIVTTTKQIITKHKERKPDYFGYFKIAVVLALVVFVVVKWRGIKAKVVSWLKGYFTGI